ncbi:MAG: rRNA maturation RNase YbeY [Alistipes sp.]|nr:rRNA maturation RNase YbeY [Alistipes sp.]
MVPKIGFHTDGTSYRLRGKREVAAWIGRCVAGEGFTPGDLNFIFCSAEKHLDINRTYLGHDYPTDVITFDYSDLKEKIVSGDIFVDPETVRRNARRYGATARGEMLRVLIHGVLHLCGYKDKTTVEQALMREAEDRCIAMFGPL